MKNLIFLTQIPHRAGLPSLLRHHSIWHILLLVFAITVAVETHAAATSQLPNSQGGDPKPEDATKAILGAFDKYEVVGMGEAHNQKDLDDFILSLVRNPAFPDKVNDVAVECGNSLYQPVLDRYISGEDVPFADVRQVWRNTTQPMCSLSGFFEELFPLVRRINQRLPLGRKLRMLAGDSPIDWSNVKGPEDLRKPEYSARDVSISTVMEKEVLSKHRKALMLFGEFHLFHDDSRSAVGSYEKKYPNITYVIIAYHGFGNSTSLTDQNATFEARMASWPVPSLVSIKGTWLADLDKSYFFSPPLMVSGDCKGRVGFPENEEKRFSREVDAMLYLGPRDTLLTEQTPADIVSDTDYVKEMQRRIAISKFAWDLNPQTIVTSAGNPFLYDPERGKNIQAMLQNMIKACLDNQSRSSSPPSQPSSATSTPPSASK